MINARIRGIGVDAVTIARMDSRRMGSHVLSRLFHPSEIAQAIELEEQARQSFLASRFAAKEALVKALGTGFRGIGPAQIAVAVDDAGKPHIELSEQLIQKFHLESATVHLSLTHENSIALAFVVVEETDGPF